MVPPWIRAKANLKTLSTLSDEEREQRKADDYNAMVGDLKYMDCPKCKNKGYVAVVEYGSTAMARCSCLELRSSIRRMLESGINDDYRLETYEVTLPWQKPIVQSAEAFLKEPVGWFYIGGQVGCGKSHVCTGIVRKLIEAGSAARYMLWRDDSAKIKASIKYPDDYAALVEPLKNVKVLYIDDFWKTDNSNAKPTTADINLAFEILNARYNRKDLITIISSEYYVSELLDIDQAVGSRIFERSRMHCNNIARDKKKNYRLYGGSNG